MPKLVAGLGHIKCYSLSSTPDLLKTLAILSDANVRRSEVYKKT